MNQTIGKKIQLLRKQKGMSQQDLSDILNITRQTISKWESDQTLPDLNVLLKMSEIFNVSIAYIVGVEEDNKSISEMYELIQTILNNQQKSSKYKSVIQTFTILLCILSLGLNISMKYQLDQQAQSMNNQVTNPLEKNKETIVAMYNRTSDRFTRIKNNLYLTDNSILSARYYDLKNMSVSLYGEFYLHEYTENTKVTITLDPILADEFYEFELTHQENNLYVFDEKLPLVNFYQIQVLIDHGDGKIHTSDISNSVENNFFDHAFFHHMNLFIPLNEEGKLQLDTLEFDPTYYNTNHDNLYMGYLDGEVNFRLYRSTQSDLIGEFKVPLNEKSIISLNEDLPMNTPIYITVDYILSNPNKEAVTGNFGQGVTGDNQTTYIYFIIENENERYRIFQLPEYYDETTDTYLFDDR